jgi:transcriptional regulator with XRE-family HTH domain
MKIGMRIAQARKARGWTQEGLAERSGLHKQTISEWERGNRTPSTDALAKVADALGVSLQELVHGTASGLSESQTIGFYVSLAIQLLEEAPPRVRNRVSGPLEGISRIVGVPSA